MIPIKILLSSEVPVKKNTIKELWYTTNKAGIKHALDRPVKYYTKAYQNWVRTVVPTLEDWKIKNSDKYDFPLRGEYVISFLMFRKHRGIVDSSALYEGLQDLLIGKTGSTLDYYRTINRKRTKVKYNHDRYKILDDDNCTLIRSHGASTVFYTDKPYVVILISEWKASHTGALMELLHPGTSLTQEEIDIAKGEQQTSMFGSEEDSWRQFLNERRD